MKSIGLRIFARIGVFMSDDFRVSEPETTAFPTFRYSLSEKSIVDCNQAFSQFITSDTQKRGKGGALTQVLTSEMEQMVDEPLAVKHITTKRADGTLCNAVIVGRAIPSQRLVEGYLIELKSETAISQKSVISSAEQAKHKAMHDLGNMLQTIMSIAEMGLMNEIDNISPRKELEDMIELIKRTCMFVKTELAELVYDI